MLARKYKIGIMAILMVAACSFMYYFHVFLGAGTVVSLAGARYGDLEIEKVSNDVVFVG